MDSWQRRASSIGYEEITITEVKIEPDDTTVVKSSSSDEGEEETIVLLPNGEIKVDSEDPLGAAPPEEEGPEREKKDDDQGEGRQYTCLRCGFITKKDEELRDHMFSWHPEGMKDSLPKYMQKKIEVKKAFKCSSCPSIFPLQNMLKVHELQHTKKDAKKGLEGRTDSSTNTLTKAILQPSTDATQNTLNTLKRKSEAASIVISPKQPKDYAFASGTEKGDNPSTPKLTMKIATTSSKKKSNDGMKEFNCVECDFKTKRFSTLKGHYQRNHFKRGLDCDSTTVDEMALASEVIVGDDLRIVTNKL